MLNLVTSISSPRLPISLVRRVYSRELSSKVQCSLGKQNTSSIANKGLSISLSLFTSGFILGPILDSLHSRVNLVVYQNGAINIGPLHTDIWVPPLLGLFYCTVGLFQLFLDEKASSSLSQLPNGSLEKTVTSLVALALFIELSAELFKNGVANNIEAYILFGMAQFVWLSLDRTRLGFTLASFLGITTRIFRLYGKHKRRRIVAVV